MIREADLRELVEFDGHGSPVLSLYLNVDPRQVTTEQYKLKLRNLLDGIEGMDVADRERVERFFDLEYDRQSCGVACFSCQKQGFWRVYALDVPVDDAIMIDRRPLVRRLVDVIDTFGYLGVVNVDKQGARFFSFHMGTLEEATGVLGEEVRRHKQGGWAAARYQRHEDETALANMRSAAELTEQHARHYQWRRLVLAGADGTLRRFTEMLPAHIQKLVVGSTPIDFSAGVQEVRERAEAIAQSARQTYNQQLATELLTTAGKEAGAVLGLSPTLDALQSGRVYQLLFSEDYRVDDTLVQRCTACNYLSVGSSGVCPVCGGANEPMPDAINSIARRAISQGAQVIVLPPQNPLAAEGNHIGAYLRY